MSWIDVLRVPSRVRNSFRVGLKGKPRTKKNTFTVVGSVCFIALFVGIWFRSCFFFGGEAKTEAFATCPRVGKKREAKREAN